MLLKRLKISFAIIRVVLLCISFSFTAKSQIIYTIAGDGYLGNVGNNVPAVCAGTPFTSGICLDGKGNLYLTCSNSIRKIDLSSGIITTIAGSDTWGHTGDGGPALTATLEFPYDLCTDKNDNLYISEWGGHYIRKINTKTGIISTIAGMGIPGFSGDNGPAIGAAINSPEGIFTDAAGNIYFADSYNSRIRKINAGTGVITTIAGTGVSLNSGDGGLAVNAGVPYPNDVNIDVAGNIYFSEALSGNSSRIRKIAASTGIVTTVAGNNNFAYSGDGGAATAAGLNDPNAVFVDKSGNVYISTYDDSRIRKVDAVTGVITTIAGNGITAFTGDGGAAVNASLYYPKGIWVDDNGDVYIADHTSGRIRKISPGFTIFPSLHVSITIAASATGICPGAPVGFSATLDNAGADPQFSWQVNGVTVNTSGATFTTSLLNDGDIVTCNLVSSVCNNFFTSNSNAVTINYKTNTAPQVAVSANKTSICTGEEVNFTAAAKDAGTNPSYQWKLNSADAGTNSPLFSSSSLVNGDKINCVITPDPIFVCGTAVPVISEAIIMQVNTAQAAAVKIASSVNNICPGEPVIFNAIASNTGSALSYQWKINGLSTGNNKDAFTYGQFADNDVVTCEISGAGVCLSSPVTSAPFIMKVKTNPVIVISPADTTIAAGTQVQLLAFVPVNAITYQWTPSSALINAATLAPVTVPLQSSTIFELSVIAGNGCTVTAKSNIKLFSKPLMPGAFSPNGDGLNEVFRIPQGAQLKLERFSIYNRLGNMIFTTTDINKGWDGNINGIKKEPGVYVFVVSGTDDKGPVLLKGSFLLIR